MSISLWKKRSPTVFSPINGELGRLRDEMERMIDRFLIDPSLLGTIEPKGSRIEGWIPPLDVSETDTEVTVRAEIPGIPAKDIDVSVSGNTLSISGEKEEKFESRGEDFCQCERRFGAFRRVVELPDGIDADKITAESDNGVVTIHLAKQPGAKSRHIEIKAPPARKVPVSA
jgi:HSP20 family protein